MSALIELIPILLFTDCNIVFYRNIMLDAVFKRLDVLTRVCGVRQGSSLHAADLLVREGKVTLNILTVIIDYGIMKLENAHVFSNPILHRIKRRSRNLCPEIYHLRIYTFF